MEYTDSVLFRFETVESNSTVQTVEQQMSKPKGEQLV